MLVTALKSCISFFLFTWKLEGDQFDLFSGAQSPITNMFREFLNCKM